MSRRRLMLRGAAAGLAAVLPAPGLFAAAANGSRVLVAAPLAEPGPALAYDGTVPGPLLRLRRGDAFSVRLVNGLDAPTAIDWHGLRHAPTAAAPPARPTVAPGESLDMRLACVDAGTFWYHAVDPEQTRRGLYGLVVVEEDTPPQVDRDLPLVIADAPAPRDGVASLVANGGPAASLPVQANERVRLRLVNAASAVVSVRLVDHRPIVMALDGHPCEPFIARDARVFLAPGNRADLSVDMALAPGATAAVVAETEGGAATLATFAYGETPRRPALLAPPAPLPGNDLPARMDFASALKSDVAITGAAGAVPPRPTFSVRRGRAVMLGFSNRTAAIQVVRVGGHAFRLLDRLDDGWKPFWLDTLAVPPGSTQRIAFLPDRAGGFSISAADIAGKPGLATWFAVS